MSAGRDSRYPPSPDAIDGGYALNIAGFPADILSCVIGVDQAGTGAVGTRNGVLIGRSADNTTIRDCVVGAVADGPALTVDDAEGVTIDNCRVGVPSTTAASASTALANSGVGIYLTGTAVGATVMGSTVANRYDQECRCISSSMA